MGVGKNNGKRGNKKKNLLKKSSPKSATKDNSENTGSSSTIMMTELPNATEKYAENHVEHIVVSVDNEEAEKVEEKTFATLVTQENAEKSVESTVVVVPVVDEDKKEKDEIVTSESESKRENEVEKQEEKIEHIDAVEDNEDVRKNDECKDEEDKADEETITDNANVRKRKNSCKSGGKEKTKQCEPEKCTTFDWEKKDEEYNVQQAIFVKSYNKKFAVVLQVFNPEFRYAAGIGPCETFDKEGVQKILDKMKDHGFAKPWPFDENFKASAEEIRLFLAEVLNQTKMCLRLACAERGYEYKSGKLINQPISAVWGEKIIPIKELKTINAIVQNMKEAVAKAMLTEGQEGRFWAEFETIFGTIVPALERFDSKVLAENSIADIMGTIYGRKELGYEIKEEEVDMMLEQSLQEDGFGEFTPTVLYAPSVFSTVKQLKLIYAQLERMSKVTDIRVKLAGVQTITRIFEKISKEEAANVLEEFKEHPKILVEKMFGLNPMNFDINRCDPKRSHYFKIFYTALGENCPKDDVEFFVGKLVAVLSCFYLVFSALEINTILFKILGTASKNNCEVLDRDKEMIRNALLELPKTLKKRLEIGECYKTGEVTENTDSMYFQVKQVIRSSNKDFLLFLENFIGFVDRSDGSENVFYGEKVFRVAMTCIETSSHKAMAVETLKILGRPAIQQIKFSKKFFEDLIILALSKYSVPDGATPEKKYEFMATVFEILEVYKQNHLLVIDEPTIVEKWANMGHPWFSVLYLSHRFPVLKFSTPVTTYPWLSADLWTDGKKDPSDLKNYILLAKVLTAWPKCTDMIVLANLVYEHVPQTVHRQELYKGMREYVSDFTISDNWKRDYLNALSDKIAFLTPGRKITKADKKSSVGDKTTKKDGKGKPVQEKTSSNIVKKIEESNTSVVPVADETKPSPKSTDAPKQENVAVEKEKSSESVMEVVSETSTEDLKQEIEPLERKSDIVQLEEQKQDNLPDESVNTNKDDSQKDGGNILVEDIKEKTEVAILEENIQVELNDGVTLKSLRESDPNAFHAYYETDTWDSLDERVTTEIYRQRKQLGYSNKY